MTKAKSHFLDFELPINTITQQKDEYDMHVNSGL